MKKIIFSLTLTLAVMVLGGFVDTNSASAATFPNGCVSTLGYSVTNGAPCNGTSTASPNLMQGCASGLGFSVVNGAPCNGETVATTNPMQGCSSALGFSITGGLPCSGQSSEIPYLAGCNSIYGFSTINANPCNGTSIVSYSPYSTPGTIFLPTTGDGGNANTNVMLLVSSGILAMLGIAYLVRKPNMI